MQIFNNLKLFSILLIMGCSQVNNNDSEEISREQFEINKKISDDINKKMCQIKQNYELTTSSSGLSKHLKLIIYNTSNKDTLENYTIWGFGKDSSGKIRGHYLDEKKNGFFGLKINKPINPGDSTTIYYECAFYNSEVVKFDYSVSLKFKNDSTIYKNL